MYKDYMRHLVEVILSARVLHFMMMPYMKAFFL